MYMHIRINSDGRYVRNLIKRGMPLQDVAILLGHVDINMTAGTYYDASDDMIEYEYIRYAA